MTLFKRFKACLGPVGLLSLLTFGSMVGGCVPEGERALTRDGFCEKWAEAACSTEVVSVCQASSVGDCEVSQMQSCLDEAPDDFIDRGVEACLEAVRKAYVDADLTARELEVVTRYGAPCDDVFLSNEQGEPCSADSDCESALQCVLKDKNRGTCETSVIIAPGYACPAPEETCEDGFFCDGKNCIAALKEGEDCQNDHQCGPARYCEGTCAPRIDVSDDCESDSQCLSGICYGAAETRTCVDRLRLSLAEPMCESLR